MKSAKHRSFRCLLGGGALLGFGVTLSGVASAQVAATTTTTTTTTPVAAPAPASAPPAPAQTGMTLPGATPDPAADAADHASVVGHFGIGYMGRRTIVTDVGAADPVSVDAPVIGARYWLDPLIGIDAGLGMLLSAGSNKVGNVSTDSQGYTVFILHGGVPLALAGSKHFSFQVVPEANIGFSSSQRAAGGDKLSGFHLDLGARAGAEVQFGFIGIPELSLQAGVGLALTYDRVKATPAAGGDATVQSRTSLGTSVGDNPWNIFTGNIAALYYFD